ncbi:MAG: iron-containing alcohol dehydrogenase [Candidatus Odinarchaeota archaeon]
MWTFSSPRSIAFGEGALDELQILQGQGSKALIITDENVEKLFLEKLTGPLSDLGFEHRVFNEVEPDPSFETCFKAARVAEEYKPDWIFALGGGSVMDTAKAAFFIYEKPDEDFEGVVPFINYGLRKKVKGLVSIPTTSGTGAEASPFMIVTDTSEHRKITPTSREVICDLAIIDPVFTLEMPPMLTATTGLDALAHTVEAFICEWHNDFSDGLAIHALKMIFKYLPRAYKNGKSDKEAREKMHTAASIAGLALGSSLAAEAHAMGHSAGATLGLPHGLCVGIFLPRFVEYTANRNPSRVALLSRELCINTEDDKEAANELVQRIESLMEEIGIPPRLKEFNVSEEILMDKMDRLVELAGIDNAMLASDNPPTPEQFKKLFLAGFHGTRVDF